VDRAEGVTWLCQFLAIPAALAGQTVAGEAARWKSPTESGPNPPGGTFIYFISGAKVRNPAAAQALIERL
jgi:hypothetical protein